MTTQEIFTTVATHLLTQKEPARLTDPKTGTLSCMYRAPDGKKCAVGCLIPDELYDPGMEMKSVVPLVREFPNLPEYLKENLPLLKELQSIHDEKPTMLWREVLEDLAYENGLKFPEGV